MDIYDEPLPYVSPAERRARRMVRAAVGVALVVGLTVGSAIVVRVGAEAMLGQCSPSWLTGTDPQICLNAGVSGRQLVVSGSASLEDGAVIDIWAEDSGTTYSDHWATDTAASTVVAGAFGHKFDVSGWGAGTITVYAEFHVDSGQPSGVVDRYGDDGAGLRGPDVQPDYQAGNFPPQMVQVSINVDLSAA